MRELVVVAGVVVGVFFMFVASLGVLRFRDLFLRVHAPTKAATLGLFALVGALLVAVPEIREAEAILVALFIGATIPVSAHILLRGAYRTGIRPADASVDEYAETSSAPSRDPPPRGTVPIRPAPPPDR